MKELLGSEISDFAALHCPIAPLTWSLFAELPNTAEETGDIPVRFSRPVEILGIQASVIPKHPITNFVVPTINDIDVSLISDNEDLWTKRLTESGPEGGMVPLASLTVQIPRLLRIVPQGDAPDFTFKFAWAQFIATDEEIYETALIRLGIYARYITAEMRDAWIAANKLRKG
jgi:hypothetical protein